MDKTVVKAFTVLEVLAHTAEPMGVTALARMANLGKSNVHRLLQTLQELGYIRKTDEAAYTATLRIWELGSQIFSRVSVRDLARPYMALLAEVSKETVHLAVLEQHQVLYIDKIDSKEPVRAYTQLGGRAPAYCTATGKVMLAFLGDEEVSACFVDVQQFTPRTIVNRARFADEARQVRQRRYAINRGEWRADVLGLAAPIVAGGGSVQGAIGVSGPASRLHVDDLQAIAPRVVEYARLISASMGCSAADWEKLGRAQDAELPQETSAAQPALQTSPAITRRPQRSKTLS